VGSRRILACAALAAFVLVAAAKTDASSIPTRTPGVLTVAVDVPTVGLALGTVQPNGTITGARGFEVDLGTAVARRLGLKVRFVEVPFVQTYGKGAKPFDVAIEHVTITPQRERAVDFSKTYLVTNKGVLLAPGVAPPATIAALRKLRLCAQTGTTSLAYLRNVLKPTPPTHDFPAVVDVLRAVSDGFCQGMLADLPIVTSAYRADPTLYGGLSGQIATNEHYGAVFAKGSPLRAPVGSALSALVASGAVERLATRWFGQGWNRIPTLR
jgi:polar amino acid transport system substrate-binding protein